MFRPFMSVHKLYPLAIAPPGPFVKYVVVFPDIAIIFIFKLVFLQNYFLHHMVLYPMINILNYISVKVVVSVLALEPVLELVSVLALVLALEPV